MSAGRWTWLLGRLDALLPENRHHLTPGELGRYRVLLGSTVLLAATSLVLAIISALGMNGGAPLVKIGTGAAIGFALILVYLRAGGALRRASLLVCGTMLAGYMLTTFLMPRQIVASHAASLLIPLLSVYLMGVKVGLVFTGFFCLNSGILLPLYQSGFGSREPIFANSQAWIAGVLDSLILLLGWGLSSLFGIARDDASATVRDSERKLHSLLESTTDPVCSLDERGRAITSNSVARKMFQEMYGRELRPGAELDQHSDPVVQEQWRNSLQRALRGESVRFEWIRRNPHRTWVFDVALHPLWGEGDRPVGVTLFGRDITERKEAEAKLGELHRGLMEVSRQAGMAEMATGVLHNVGNMFNSVNVSASLVLERLKGSRTTSLLRASELLREHETNLPTFLTEDARGRQLPQYMSTVSRHLVQEQEDLLTEMKELLRNVEHIREVVSLQQENARVVGRVELVTVPELIDSALRLHLDAFERLGIRIQREYAEMAPLPLDRHRLLQILVNLLGNARHALAESGRDDKWLSLRVRREGEEWLRIEVEDNGVGIAPEHLSRLFSHGFTTKKEGHGFGLHSSALAAEAMKGRLRCESQGKGHGARFTLELPLSAREPPA
ncbi:nitrogen regulation protein NtrB [Cystobacter fuscus]|uniref:histidine kinase n=1 Tax=Cystobacter fuscus TaxID=43 RepID=A0A250J0D2_9BACT|nr:ATP-binding protein [Cystobacter fuscus]ATB36968.1 nitrogen regulation protein NtrB [Cystobacter fuscus]